MVQIFYRKPGGVARPFTSHPTGKRAWAKHMLRLAMGGIMVFAAGIGAALAQAESGAPEGSASGSFIRWMDNSLTLLPYGWGFAVDPKQQTTLTFEHTHDSSIGDLFFFVDATWFHGNGSDDRTWYGEFSPRLSAGKIFDTDLSFHLLPFSTFQVKDILLAAQYERGKDADQAEAILLGIGFDLDVREAGILGRLGKFKYMQLNLYARSELTENAPDGFRDMQITMVAGYPFDIGRSKFLIDGYFDWVLGIGSEESSFHLNPQVKLDLGNYWSQPDKLYVGVELDFWWNKYQIPDTAAFDTNQTAVSLLLKYHF